MRFANHIALVVGAAGSAAPSDPCKTLAEKVGLSTDGVVCNSIQMCEGIVRRAYTTPIEVISYPMITSRDIIYQISCADANDWMNPGVYLRHSREDDLEEQDEEESSDDEALLIPPPLGRIDCRISPQGPPCAVVRVRFEDIVVEGPETMEDMPPPRLARNPARDTDQFEVLRSRKWEKATVSGMNDDNDREGPSKRLRTQKSIDEDSLGSAVLCDRFQWATSLDDGRQVIESPPGARELPCQGPQVREQFEILYEAIESHITPLVLNCPSLTKEQVTAIDVKFADCESGLSLVTRPFHSGLWLPRYIKSNDALIAVIRDLETAVAIQSSLTSSSHGRTLLWRASMLISRLKDIAQIDQSDSF